jgi:hypothetical protein
MRMKHCTYVGCVALLFKEIEVIDFTKIYSYGLR